MFQTGPQLWRLLLPERRRAAIGLLGLTLVGTLLETLGIGAVVPAIGLLTTQDLAASYPALAPWLALLRLRTREQIAVACMVALVTIYAVKALYLAFLAWRQSKFAFDVQASVAERLFVRYLRQPWTFHIQRNSAELLRNITTEVNNLNNVINALAALITEGFVILAVAALLMTFEPVGAAAVLATLALAAITFHRATRARLLHWGDARQRHEGLRIRHVQQSFSAVKDVKLLGRERDVVDEFRVHNRVFAHVGERQTTLQQLPRLWLELLAVTGLAGLVLVMIAQAKPIDSIVPTVALFAAAAFRLMPSVVRVMNSFQAVRYYAPAIDTLEHELALPAYAEPESVARLSFHRDLVVRDVTFSYPQSSVDALDGISLTIPSGTSVGLIGASGSGKTTLADVILGLLTPARGRVTVDGVDIGTNLRGWQDQVGYVPQTIVLTDDTLRRNVAFGYPSDQIDDAAVRRAIEAARLDELVASLPDGLETPVGERGVKLSGGQRQRVGIARALYHDPSVLVLDEATSALDTETEDAVMDAIKAFRGEKTLIIVAHRLSTVAHCDRLFRLERGHVVAAGSLEEVISAEYVPD